MSLPHNASCPVCSKSSVFPISLKHAQHNLTMRPIKLSDNEHIAHHANDPVVARYLNPLFPKPYLLKDADEFIERTYKTYQSELINNMSINPPHDLVDTQSISELASSELEHSLYHSAVSVLAICVDDQFIGTIFYFPMSLESIGGNLPPASHHVVDQLNFQPVRGEPLALGYWMGQAFHSQGIGKLVLPAYIEYAEASIKQSIEQTRHQSDQSSESQFNHPTLKPLQSWIMTIHNDNLANQALADRIAFSQTGYWIDTKQNDAIVRIYTKAKSITA